MARHYDTPTKENARQFIVDCVVASGVEVKRAFTLPSSKGYCAQLFKKSFPGCYIVGVERDRLIVMHSDLVIGDGPDTYKLQCVDELYLGNTADLVNPDGVLQKRIWRKVPTLDQGRAPKSIRVRPGIGKFDLIFLDYTAIPSMRLRDEVNHFVEKFANSPCIVAVTVTVTKYDRADALSMFPNAVMHSYKNASSDMALIVWKAK